MNSDYIILDIEWDHQIIKDSSGKKGKLIRGVDYDIHWKKLGEGYSKNEKAIFIYSDKCFQKFYKTIDFPSFQLVKANKNTFYFKDKDNVYLNSYMNNFGILENANPADFKVIDIENGFSTSGKYDYNYNEKMPFCIKDAYIYEGGSYQKVNNEIYFAFRKKIHCDPDTFQVIDTREWYKTVFKDKNHVYHKGEIITDADPNTFHFLENCINDNKRPRYTDCDIHYYAKDKNFAYFINSPFEIKKIKTKDIEGFDFKVVDSVGYAFDKFYEYMRGIKKKKIE